MTKLTVHSRPEQTGGYANSIDSWELEDESVRLDYPSITWWMNRAERVIPLVLSGQILVQTSVVGELDIRSWMFPSNDPRWVWKLNREGTLSEIERLRRGNDLTISFELQGLASVPTENEQRIVIPIEVLGRHRIPQSDWARWLVSWHYEPGKAISWPLDDRHWPEWNAIQNDMEGATLALGRGEGHQALTQCLSALEKIQTAPYNAKSWENKFAVDDQKRAALSELFSGLGTYLNKVGHHRAREGGVPGGDNPQSPVEHWEAELAVAMSQLILAYIRRLPRREL